MRRRGFLSSLFAVPAALAFSQRARPSGGGVYEVDASKVRRGSLYIEERDGFSSIQFDTDGPPPKIGQQICLVLHGKRFSGDVRSLTYHHVGQGCITRVEAYYPPIGDRA